MNTQAIRSHNLDFLNPDTISACITPLRSDAVMGYIIFENTDIKTFSEGTESIIIFISEIMGEWLSGKDWDAADNERDAAADGNGATQTQTDDGPSVFDDDMPVMQRFRKIKGLAVDYALERMGGLEEAYEKTVRILARLMPEATEKMDRHIASKNLKDFTVEVHGIKGVLRNIGAVDLGNDAAALEGAAIEKRMEFCAERYVPFKEALMRFSERLDAALAEKPDTVKDKIDKETLLAAVIAAKEAANGFDAMGAADTLAEAAKLSYNDETDVLLKDVLLALEVFDCKGALINIIKMEEILNG
jgi:HPt (histidine-containing phosphotransfer) domain-containing protein